MYARKFPFHEVLPRLVLNPDPIFKDKVSQIDSLLKTQTRQYSKNENYEWRVRVNFILFITL